MDSSQDPNTDDQILHQAFADAGLELLGVASVASPHETDQARQRYHDWLDQGRHGTMRYLERHEAAKYQPQAILEGTKSVLVTGISYGQERPPLVPGEGLVARYAWGRDYHKVLLKKLKTVEGQLQLLWPQERWRAFTDTAPLDERWWSERAGASFTARNSLAINRKLGSMFVLGEILTTRAFTATGPLDHAHGSCPSGCRRCSAVCPTGALDEQGRIDARLCLSYLTIEHRGPIEDKLKPQLGNWLFGCDLCQEVCPFNLTAPRTKEPEFLAWKAGPSLPLNSLLALDDQAFTAKFGGSPVHRTGRNGLVRNACLVAANQKRYELLEVLQCLTADSDEGVADAARWAVDQLQGRPS